MSSVKQILRFGTIGVAATLTHICIALVLNEAFGVLPVWSNFIAFLTAWPVSYFGNFFWTFQTSMRHQRSLPRFAITAVAGLLLSQLIVWFATDILGYSLRWALVPAVIIVPALSFLMSRYWVFPAQKPKVAE